MPFSLLALLLMSVSRAFGSSSGGTTSIVFVFCGGIYIYGSIYALRGHLPLSALVVTGLVLNGIGAFAWAPALRFHDGVIFGLVGIGLTLVWMTAIISEYRAERH